MPAAITGQEVTKMHRPKPDPGGAAAAIITVQCILIAKPEARQTELGNVQDIRRL